MDVLIINGSPHESGNTRIAIEETIKVFKENDVNVHLINIGSKPIRGCISCNSCAKTGKCVFDDAVNEAAEIFKNCNVLIVATPVYFASANGSLVSFLDRLFYSSNFSKTMKVGASIAVARRGGISATFDELNKYFTISGMPIASSNYWNGVHGRAPGEATEDEEGLQTMRTIANNMVFLMKSIELGIQKYGLPKAEEKTFTNFVR